MTFRFSLFLSLDLTRALSLIFSNAFLEKRILEEFDDCITFRLDECFSLFDLFVPKKLSIFWSVFLLKQIFKSFILSRFFG